MNIPIILFFISLLGITFMIGRRLYILKVSGATIEAGNVALDFPYLEEMRLATKNNVKRYGYLSLVTTLRLYMRTEKMLQDKVTELRTQMKARFSRTRSVEKKEISKFLRVIGEYKNKIREIKRRISQEENL